MSKPARIVTVIERLDVGGPALHVSYLTSELDRIAIAEALSDSFGLSSRCVAHEQQPSLGAHASTAVRRCE